MDNMVDITFDDVEVRTVLGRIAMRASDRVELMKDISGIMHDAVEDNFAKEGRPKWRTLSQRTVDARRRKGHWPGQILQVRGRLAASIQEKADNDSAVVGTNVKYARIHQFGGTVNHKERSQVVHFKRGTVDQFTNADNANRSVHMPNGRTLHFRKGAGAGFARANMRASYAMKVTIGAHQTVIPARPFLHLEPSDLRRIMDAAKQFLAGL